MELKYYPCPTCINRDTPLCELCTYILSPSGKERKPKYYIRLVEVEPDPALPELRIPLGLSADLEERAVVIARYLAAGLPIPSRVVLEYNKLAEHKTDKEE